MSHIWVGLGLLAVGAVVVFVVLNIYGACFSRKSFVKFKRFYNEAERIYRETVANGLSPRYALRRVSKWRHPELSERVHEAMCAKFDDLGALIHVIFWGLEREDPRNHPLTDDAALSIIETTTVVQKGPYDYRVEVGNRTKD